MASDLRSSENFNELKRKFSEFLEQTFEGTSYQERLRTMVERQQSRFIFSINDLREFDPAFALRFIRSPAECIEPFQDAVREAVELFDPDYFSKTLQAECRIGVEGSFGSHQVTPRGLRAELLNHLVCVEGIVTRCSMVHPKVHSSVHYCEATGESIRREYRDHTTLMGLPTTAAYPQRDAAGNPLSTEFGLSVYRDHQTFTIQEMPERAPAGQLPRSVDIVIEDDLVETIKPGDRIQVVGVYRALPNRRGGSTNGVFRTVLLGTSVAPLRKQSIAPKFTEGDLENIRRMGEKKGVFDVLSQSVAPSIFGHDIIKKALLLLLLGGVEKNLSTGTHIRGDINMLLVGDPSTAKSQILRFVLNMAPLAVSTTGRGSTGVGLTAAVVSDPETGERTLQAGAMVLADRGVVCVDEFDKMSEIDRVAMHEVMEQQTVTIAKAGVHTALNARCSVVAAANPVYGQYNRDRDPGHNIGLPDSLLSRFDLLFIVLDSLSPVQDAKVAEHVLKLHRYRRPGDEDGSRARGSGSEIDSAEYANASDAGDASARTDTEVYQRYDPTLHSRQGLVTVEFLKKYIFYAKSRFRPKMSEEAARLIAEAYAEFRTREGQKTIPITPRSLESLIRLATAHAKCRLSNVVTAEDTAAVIGIMKYALFLEGQMESQTFKDDNVMPRGAGNNDDGDANDGNDRDGANGDGHSNDAFAFDDMDHDDDVGRLLSSSSSAASTHSRSRVRRAADAMDDEDESADAPSSDSGHPQRKRQKTPAIMRVSAERLQLIKDFVQEFFASQRKDVTSVEELEEYIAKEHPTDRITDYELRRTIDSLANENHIMVDEHGEIYRV
nr:DNA replication licensing factor MCM3 [Seculamonas ecuadoriensis]